MLQSGGANREWNPEHQVPYIQKDNIWVGYEDEESLSIKVIELTGHSYVEPGIVLTSFLISVVRVIISKECLSVARRWSGWNRQVTKAGWSGPWILMTSQDHCALVALTIPLLRRWYKVWRLRLRLRQLPLPLHINFNTMTQAAVSASTPAATTSTIPPATTTVSTTATTTINSSRTSQPLWRFF